MVKSRKSERLKKGQAKTEPKGVLTAAEKWSGKTITGVKEVSEEESKAKKQKDLTKRLSIDVNFLKTLTHRETKPKKIQREPVLKTYCVKIEKPKENTKTVCVLKPADPDSPVKPIENVANFAGPRFSQDGAFIQHSILGNLQDFQKEAQRRGQFKHLYEAQRNVTDKGVEMPNEDGSTSLKLWNAMHEDWCKTQKRLANKLKRPIGDLLMRTPDVYPKWIDYRNQTAAALEATMIGYGEKRVYAQFWNLPTQYGHDPFNSILSSLRRAERGDFRSEVRGIPESVAREIYMGKVIAERSYKPHYTEYLKRQTEALKDMITMLNPHPAELSDLMVKGHGNSKSEKICHGRITVSSPELAQQLADENITLPVVQEAEENYTLNHQGPELTIGSRVLRWKMSTEAPIHAVTLLFSTEPGQRQLETMCFANSGSTLLHYDWERVPIKNAFGLVKPRRQQFYFLSENGALPPGGFLRLPVLFKSDYPGNFKEIWKLKTRPILCNGADILVYFRARTVSPDIFKGEVAQIEKAFEERRKDKVITEVMSNLMSSIKTPSRPLSPCTLDKPPEAEFKENYPELVYNNAKLQQMEDLFQDIIKSKLVSDISKDYDFSVNNLRSLMYMFDTANSNTPRDSPNYEEAMHQMYYKSQIYLLEYYNLTAELCFRPIFPHESKTVRRHHIATQVFQMTVEQFVETAFAMAYKINIPATSQEAEEPEESYYDKKKRRHSVFNKTKPESRKSIIGPGSQKAANQTASSKSRKKGTDSPLKTPPPLITPASPMPPAQAPVESFSPIIKEKATPAQLTSYREKLYLEAYVLLQEAIDALDTMFFHMD